MAEIWEMVSEKLMRALYICLIAVVVVLLITALWHLLVYWLTQKRLASAKQIYNAIKLGDTKEKALQYFRGYTGSSDQYVEEALLSGGKHEVVLCLLFGFGHGETGEVRLTFVDDQLVQKQQNGIW